MIMNDINSKNTANQMRILLCRMRKNNGDWQNESVQKINKSLDVRDMLKITRKLNEDGSKQINLKTAFDQSKEEEKFLNNFRDLTINVKFIDLEIFDNLVFWGGTIDGIIQFIYKVTPDESTSGVEFNYLSDFSPDNPENDEIVNRIEGYYDTFYKYWQNNIIQQ